MVKVFYSFLFWSSPLFGRGIQRRLHFLFGEDSEDLFLFYSAENAAKIPKVNIFKELKQLLQADRSLPD